MPLTQEGLNFRLYLIHFLGRGDLYIDGVHVRDGEHALLRRRQRDVDHIVLILSDGLALARRNADDLERLIVDADILSDRILRAKEVGRDRRADHGNAAAFLHIARRNECPVLHLQRADLHQLRRHAIHLRIPVEVAVHDLIGARDGGRYIVNAFDLALNCLRIVVFQGLSRARLAAHTALIGRARHDDEHIRPETREGVRDARTHAHADRDHGDDRAHADDDAEHREEGAQLVGEQCVHCHAEAFLKQHPSRPPSPHHA